MKKVFGVEVDCANCAAKMEDACKKIEGVKSIRINFMTQKMTLEADDESFKDVLDKVVKTCKKVEPDCEIETK